MKIIQKFSSDASLKDGATFDLETVKCRGNEPWRWFGGKTASKRWVPFAAGFAMAEKGESQIEIAWSFDELEMMKWISRKLLQYGQFGITYNSRNRFDEMVVKGRFIHARTGLAAGPGHWPNANAAASAARFIPLKPEKNKPPREDEDLDWPSLVDATISDGIIKPKKALLDREAMIILHLQRDLIENLRRNRE